MATKYKVPPLHLACSTDELRPVMNHIYVKDGHGIATDGYIAVRYNLSGYLLTETLAAFEGKLIHKDCWKAISQLEIASTHVNEEGRIQLHTKGGKVYYDFYQTEEKYPDVISLLRLVAWQGDNHNNGIIGIHPKKLATLYEIMSMAAPEGVQLAIGSEPGRAFLMHNNEAVAIIMPVTSILTRNEYLQDARNLLDTTV